MTAKTKKINDVAITPLDIPKVDVQEIKGKDYFENLTPNVLLVARKNSGKTTVLYHILEDCVDKTTTVYIFCSTVYKDPSYRKIIEMLTNMGVSVKVFTDIKDGKHDYLEMIVDAFKQTDDSPQAMKISGSSGGGQDGNDKQAPMYTIDTLMFGGKPKIIKPKKPRLLTPKYAFIFDDISEDLRSPSIAYLLKKNRHFGIMNIISTQSYKDITPPAWKQIDFALLYPNLDIDTIEDIRKKMALQVDPEGFLEMYLQSTSEKYNFLYIDKTNDTYRHNFSEKFVT